MKAEHETNEDAFGLAICALDLMARAGEVIENMQTRGELATQKDGRPDKCNSLLHLSDVLGDGARMKASRYKTAAKANRDEYYESLDRERDKPSYSGFLAFHHIGGQGGNMKATHFTSFATSGISCNVGPSTVARADNRKRSEVAGQVELSVRTDNSSFRNEKLSWAHHSAVAPFAPRQEADSRLASTLKTWLRRREKRSPRRS